MRFTLTAFSRDIGGSYSNTFDCKTDEEIRECFKQFEDDATVALGGNRWYMENDIDEDATEEQKTLIDNLTDF